MIAPSSPVPHVPVCHVAYARYPADPRVRKEVRTLNSAGFAVDVLCIRAPGEMGREVQAGVHVRRLPLGAHRGSRLRYAYQYATFFLLVAASLLATQVFRRYRIIHLHSLPDFVILAALPCRALGARLVLDLHESMPEIYRARFPGRAGSPMERLTLLGQRVSCALATRTITVNPTIAAILVSRGVPARLVAVVENSPDWSLDPSEALQGTTRGGATEITIVGGLNPERDLPVVLRAAQLVRGLVRVPIRWRIIGPGDAAFVRDLQTEVRRLGIEDVISIEGEVPASMVPRLLARTIVGVVSYQRNPLTEIATPNKAYEYAIAGKAMVVADLPGLRRLLGDAARYYRPGDAEDLARNLRSLLENASERELLGQAARQRIEAHRWDIMAERLIRVYLECLPGTAAGVGAGLARDAAPTLVLAGVPSRSIGPNQDNGEPGP